MKHKNLRDNYEELLTTLQGELDEERQVREMTDRLRGEVAQLEGVVEGMSAAAVRSLRAERLPALVAQLNAVAERDRAADWRHVGWQWPTDAAPDALRLRLQRVAETAAEREALAADEDAWAEHRRELDAQMAATNTNEEPAVVEQQLARRTEMLAAVIEWQQTSRLPDRIALIARLDEVMKHTADRRHELARLVAQQQAATEWLRRREELDLSKTVFEEQLNTLINNETIVVPRRIDDAAADLERLRELVATQKEWVRDQAALLPDQRDAALEQLQVKHVRLEQREKDLAAFRRRHELTEKLASLRAMLETARAIEKSDVRRSQLQAICEELDRLAVDNAAEVLPLRAEVESATGNAEPEQGRRRCSARLFAKKERAAVMWAGEPPRVGKREPPRRSDADLPPFTHLTRNVICCPLDPLKCDETEAGGCSCATRFAGGSPVRICTSTSGCANWTVNVECFECTGKLWCSNQQFRRPKECPSTFVTKAGAKGFGLFADETIQPDQLIVEMVGEIIDEAQLESRMTKPRAGGHSYFIALDDHHFIDATHRGNDGRFVNHSCEPNACMQCWLVPSREYDVENGMQAKTEVFTTLAIGVFATRKIAAGDEITIDYQMESFGKEDSWKCACGSARCRGNLAVAKPGAKHTKSVVVVPRPSTRFQKKSASQ
ncbi:hypothetical protein M3Y99_00485400 [Aphelenchoides fujianensis]|nr:hypothetical protein M3Y99_00485400 [Aphelenchoides fujianensis]